MIKSEGDIRKEIEEYKKGGPWHMERGALLSQLWISSIFSPRITKISSFHCESLYIEPAIMISYLQLFSLHAILNQITAFPFHIAMQ